MQSFNTAAKIRLDPEVNFMKILLTGANGYIGTRLLPLLVEKGHEVIALVRSGKRLELPEFLESKVRVIEADLLDAPSLEKIPSDIDAAYYLVHSMTTSSESFGELEAQSATNFRDRIGQTKASQIIYLSGLSNEEHLSAHLTSRKNVETLLRQGRVPVTTLMAGIIIGSGSASFEIIRDLVEKLPVMITPKWVKNRVQPIAVSDVLDYLTLVLGDSACLGERFEIGGPEVLSYQEVLLRFAKVRGLKRSIWIVPVLTPRLSSFWLYFMTSANYNLAKSLVDSLKNNAICKENRIREIFPKKLVHYEEAVRRAFDRIEQGIVPSSWKDALGNTNLNPDLSVYIQVPKFGTLSDVQKVPFTGPAEKVKEVIWSLGGDTGWLYLNWCWVFRGFIDRLVGGSGLRRGRTHPTRLREGDALDFWRVLLADEKKKRLLLYAEMKVPGDAWLEFKIVGQTLYQTATFRPHGVWGRIYWYALFPFHYFIFRGLARAICRDS